MSVAESHSEAKKARTLPWFTAVILVLGITMVAAFYWKQQVRITEVAVQGNLFTSTEEIAGKVDLEKELHPDSLDLAALKSTLESLTYVKKASLYVEPDGDLEITVTERTPIGLLMRKSSRAYVDTDGVVLPVPENTAVDLPLVYGFSTTPGDTIRTYAFEQIRDFLLAARRQPLAWDTISEIAFDGENGVVALSHENGVKLILGQNEFDRKVSHWNAFYSQVIRKKGIGTMQQVDLRFSNQIVSREVKL